MNVKIEFTNKRTGIADSINKIVIGAHCEAGKPTTRDRVRKWWKQSGYNRTNCLKSIKPIGVIEMISE